MGADRRSSIEKFGERLIAEILTPARETMKIYTDFESVDGTHLRRQFETLRDLSVDQRRALETLVEEAMVVTLHSFFRVLEQDQYSEEMLPGHLKLMMQDDNGVSLDVAEISDGLSGELFGWLAPRQRT